MKLKIAIFVLVAAGPAFLFAQSPAPKDAPAAAGSAAPDNSFAEPRPAETPGESTGAKETGTDPEVSAKAENAGSKITVLLLDIETDELAELQRKLQILKAVQKEIGDETRLRLEIIDEFRKIQYGLQALTLRAGQDNGGKAQKLAAIERIEKIVSASAKETVYSRSAKVSLSAFRAALGAFRADNNGLFPENPAEQLAPKYLQSVPSIRLPGHGANTNSIDVLTGVGNNEELFKMVTDSGSWLYVGDRTSPIWGTLIFNCNHKDYNGTAMYRY